MTYIVGWKRGGKAYVCADSALTMHHSEPIQMSEVSSFGEAPVNVESRQVSERAVKIVNLGRATVAVSGKVANTNKVLLALRDELRHVDDIQVAFSRAIEESLVDEDSKKSVHLILAAPNNAEATLLYYNADGRCAIGEVAEDHIINFGSIGLENRRLTWSAIKQIATNNDIPERQLACVLGLLQSYGVNKNLLTVGVGGAFYGGYVSGTEFKWQGDILYVIRQPGNYWIEHIATGIRDDAVVVKSGIKKGVVLLVNTLSARFTPDWISKWSSYLAENHEFAAYDFVTFLTAGYPNCTVVEMMRQNETLHLHMPTGAIADEHGQLKGELSLSPTLVAAVDDPEKAANGQLRTRVTFFQYEPPGPIRPA